MSQAVHMADWYETYIANAKTVNMTLEPCIPEGYRYLTGKWKVSSNTYGPCGEFTLAEWMRI